MLHVSFKAPKGKRTGGGQWKRFKDSLKISLKQFDLRSYLWEKLTLDRCSWRATTHKGATITESISMKNARGNVALEKLKHLCNNSQHLCNRIVPQVSNMQAILQSFNQSNKPSLNPQNNCISMVIFASDRQTLYNFIYR